MKSLRSKTISGIVWSLFQNIGSKGITFVVMIVLARLLTPEVFGLIGMLMVFIQVSQTLVVSGFNEALIRKKDADEEDFSSVFWINLGISTLIYSILFISAPYVAIFYEQPLLIKLLRVLSLVFVINSFSYVQEAKLRKEMRFRTLTIINIPSTIIGGGVSIIMAINGYGVWSIVFLQLVTRFTFAIQIWLYSKWKPWLVYNHQKVKALFSYGSKLMISGVLNSVFQNAYLIVIGKFFPLSTVGYYQNSFNLVRVPSMTLSSALNTVTFSSFSTVQEDDSRLKNGLKKVIQQVLFWLCPSFILAGIIAEPLFSLILGDQWLPAVPYFQILCVLGIFLPLNMFNLNILKVKGRSGLFLKLGILKKIIMVIGMVPAIYLGIWYLLGFQVFHVILSYFINSYFSGKFINYTVTDQLKDIFPIIFLSLVMGGISYGVNWALANFYDIIRIIAVVVSGFSTYLLVAKFKKFAPYLDFMEIIKGQFKKSFN